MDCSFGVDIPKVFEIYNNYKRTENKQLTIKNYELLKERKQEQTNVRNVKYCEKNYVPTN